MLRLPILRFSSRPLSPPTAPWLGLSSLTTLDSQTYPSRWGLNRMALLCSPVPHIWFRRRRSHRGSKETPIKEIAAKRTLPKGMLKHRWNILCYWTRMARSLGRRTRSTLTMTSRISSVLEISGPRAMELQMILKRFKKSWIKSQFLTFYLFVSDWCFVSSRQARSSSWMQAFTLFRLHLPSQLGLALSVKLGPWSQEKEQRSRTNWNRRSLFVLARNGANVNKWQKLQMSYSWL